MYKSTEINWSAYLVERPEFRNAVLDPNYLVSKDEFKDALKEYTNGSDPTNSPLYEVLTTLEKASVGGKPVFIDGMKINFLSFGYSSEFKASEFQLNDVQDVAFLHFVRNVPMYYDLDGNEYQEVTTYDDIIKNPGNFIKLTDVKNAFHQDNSYFSGNENNVKWTTNDGKKEYIFRETLNGWELVNDPVNQGSYNYYSPSDTIGHADLDVLTWELFGNAISDPSSEWERTVIANPLEPVYGNAFITVTPNSSGHYFDYNPYALQHEYIGNDLDNYMLSAPKADVLDGGDGIDTVAYWESGSGVTVNLGYGYAFDGAGSRPNEGAGKEYTAKFEKITNIENVDGSQFADIIVGDDGSNKITSRSGNDQIYGAGGDDLLDGGSGSNYIDGGDDIDTARFSGARDLYTINETDVGYSVRISNGGDIYSELVNVERIKFRDWEGDIADLIEEAPIGEESETLVNDNGDTVGNISIEAPTHSTGSEIEFSLNLSTSGVGTQYRIALIVDVSGSMQGSNITETKAAYVDLINYLKDQGIADVTEFAVIPFQSSATLYSGLDADEAIDKINSLSAYGGTSFGPAISKGLEFFGTPKDGISNITYFLSDGQGSGASEALQDVSDVRVFGIGSGASISSLNTIDSNNAVILSSPNDLAASFTDSEINSADVNKIEVFLNGVLAQTIGSDELVDDGATGLSFAGIINGLDASNADTLEAKVYFVDTTIPVQSVTFNVGDGVTDAVGTDGDDSIAFSLTQISVDAGGGHDTVLANNLDNTVYKLTGNGVIKLYDGDDWAHTGDNSSSGFDRVMDGGDGVDHLVYTGNVADYTIKKTGAFYKFGTATDTASNFEFVHFDDATIRLADFVTIEGKISATSVEVIEGDTDGTMTFKVSLDNAVSSDVTFDYTTISGSADEGADYIGLNGAATILAGQTEVEITVDISGDIIFEGDEFFELELSNIQGNVVFDGYQDTYSAIGAIKNDDDANQALDGTSGDDLIDAGKGTDFINSMSGNDIVNANSGNDLIIDGLGNNVLSGDDGNDMVLALSGANVSSGNSGSDFLIGGFQGDSLSGGQGNDILRGDASSMFGSSDRLNGGTGDDILMGGKGADTFVFLTNDGNDIIAKFEMSDVNAGNISGYTTSVSGADFQSGIDHIELQSFVTVNADNVMDSVSDSDDGAVFSAEGTSITFYGIAADQIHSDDFVFV